MAFFYQVTLHKWLNLAGQEGGQLGDVPIFSNYVIQTEKELQPDVGNRIAHVLVHMERCISSNSVKFGRVVFLNLVDRNGHHGMTKTYTAVPAFYFHELEETPKMLGFRSSNVLVGAWENRVYIDREMGKPRSMRYMGTVTPDDLAPHHREKKAPQSFTVDPDGPFGAYCLPLMQDLRDLVPELVDWVDVDRMGLVKHISPTVGDETYMFASQLSDFEHSVGYRQPARFFWDSYTQYLDDQICRSMVLFTQHINSQIWYFDAGGADTFSRYVKQHFYYDPYLAHFLHLLGWEAEEITPNLSSINFDYEWSEDDIPFGSLGELKNDAAVKSCLETLYSLREGWKVGEMRAEFFRPFQWQEGISATPYVMGLQSSKYEYDCWDETIGRIWSIYNALNVLTQIVVPKLRRQTLEKAPLSPRTLRKQVNSEGESFPDVFEVMPYVTLYPPVRPPYLANPLSLNKPNEVYFRFKYAGPLIYNPPKPPEPLKKAEKEKMSPERFRQKIEAMRFVAPRLLELKDDYLGPPDPLGIAPYLGPGGGSAGKRLTKYVLDKIKEKAQDWAKDTFGN